MLRNPRAHLSARRHSRSVRLRLEMLEDRLPPGEIGMSSLLTLPGNESATPGQVSLLNQTEDKESQMLLAAFGSLPAAFRDQVTAPTPTVTEYNSPAANPAIVEAVEQIRSQGTLEVLGPIRTSGPNCPGGGQGRLQSETTIGWAIGESFAFVVGYNDFRGFYCQSLGYQVTGISYSLDFGNTWRDQGSLPGGTALRGDPWLATGPDGSIYLASLWNGLQGIALLKGTPTLTGINWSNPTVATGGGNSYDKEAMAIDWNTGYIYVTFTQFGTGGRGIEVLRSINGGQSFEPNRRINTGAFQGSFPAIGPASQVYVAYNIGYPSNTGIGFALSTNLGVNWTDRGQVAPVTNFTIPGFNRGTHPLFPSMAVDTSGGPNHGNIYIAYSSAHGRNGDVYVIRSTNGGTSFSAPVKVNDDTTTGIQFYPTISVDWSGNVHVYFYDRRDAPGTASTHLYFAQSTNGGVSFDANIRVTDVPTVWGSSSDGTPNFGDYIGSMAIGDYSFVAYADGRTGTPTNADPDAWAAAVGPPL